MNATMLQHCCNYVIIRAGVYKLVISARALITSYTYPFAKLITSWLTYFASCNIVNVPVHNKIYVSWQTFGKYKLSWLLSSCYLKIHWSILVNIKHDKIKIAHHQSLIIGYLLSVFEFCRSQIRLLQCRRSKICCFTNDKHLG